MSTNYRSNGVMNTSDLSRIGDSPPISDFRTSNQTHDDQSHWEPRQYSLDEIVEMIRRGQSILSEPYARKLLKEAGADPVKRYELNDTFRRAKRDVTGLWHLIDEYHEYAPTLTMEGASMLADSALVERLVEDLLALRSWSLVASKPKAGKSTLARTLIARVLYGGNFLGRKVLQTGPVLYYSLEEPLAEVMADLKDLGVTQGAPLFIRTASMSFTGFLKTLQRDIEVHQPKLVVLDTLIRVLNLEDSNNYATVSPALDALVAVIRQNPVHLMALHHTNKTSDNLDLESILGSTAFAAAIDVGIIVARGHKDKRFIRTIPRSRRDREIFKTGLVMDMVSGVVSLEVSTEPSTTANPVEELAIALVETLKTMGKPVSRNALHKKHGGTRQRNLDAIQYALDTNLIGSIDKKIAVLAVQ